jgi:hypothetical protein
MADIWSDSEVEQHKLEIIILFYFILYSDGFTSYALQPVRIRSILNVVIEKNVENMHLVFLQDHLCMSAELSPWSMHTLLLVVLVVSGIPVQLFRCTGKRNYSLEESYN